ncbi:DNA repair protein RadA [[Phormidium ambiguum] IAM M-71]|uniref:DNA repair protein RadA n=1 Tax=[Phormidium ambiguum] IAM M-71 TaxID=454136 RepID=A0A1U7ITG3_9CYAN|nr:DNA repair protein RadA [Phormidium ambiguum]OKH40810.1 DNA repair protein RadA [Phormidium ambiguum IAM M-71]
MPKPRTSYICNECGAESPQWFGKCPSCNTYNSLEEQLITQSAALPSRGNWQGGARNNGKVAARDEPKPRLSLKFSEITERQQARWSSGYEEFNRVLGGGVVPGSLVLIGGDPGIGKSTLLLQVANQLAEERRILYVSGEESGQQVKLRASRLGVGESFNSEEEEVGQTNSEENSELPELSEPKLYVLAETDLEEILKELESLKPNLTVIDSIQTIFLPTLTSAPGSVAQVRECTAALMKVAKRDDITMLIVGHVTKEGAIAGPRVLEHLVDTVLYFEGDRFASHRLLRSVKNRFGATNEIGIFEMADRGLREVANPSELFLGNRDEVAPGTAIVVACEGTRPLVVELQALVSPTSYSSPRRSTTGVDYNRLLQILAVLEKRVGIPLSKLDAYVAAAGGLNVEEPAVDLGIAIAVVASFRDRIVDPSTVLIGEVGLGGQVRAVSQMELRLKEAAKLGFKKAIVPKGQKFPDVGLEIVPVSKVIDAIVAAIPAQPRFGGDEFSEYEDDEEDLEE